MAENDIIGGDVIGAINVTQSFSALGDVLLWLLIIGAVLGAVYIVYYLTSFKHTLIIRDLANRRKVVKKMKWKETKDKHGVVYMITPFSRVKKPLPPSEAIDITPKGKKWVEAWRGEDSESLVYANDTFDYEKYKTQHPEFQPLTTQERELLVNQIAKTAKFKKKSGFEIALQISLIMAPILLIAVIGLTLGDISEGLTNFAKPITATLNNVAESFERASENLAGIQTVDDNVPVEAPN